MKRPRNLTHPLSGLPIVPLGYGRRGPIWPILGGADDPPADPPKNDPPSNDPPKNDPPKNDPPNDKTFTQADLDRIVTERITRERTKFSDYDDLKRKAAELDKVKRDQESETEKAVRVAREEGLAAGRAEVRPGLVGAEFRAAAAGRIDAERLATLTEDIDMSRYLLDSGDVDVEKVAKKVDAWAPPVDPEKEKEKPPRRPRPDPSQGSSGKKTTSGMAAGREMFAASRPGRGRDT